MAGILDEKIRNVDLDLKEAESSKGCKTIAKLRNNSRVLPAIDDDNERIQQEFICLEGIKSFNSFVDQFKVIYLQCQNFSETCTRLNVPDEHGWWALTDSRVYAEAEKKGLQTEETFCYESLSENIQGKLDTIIANGGRPSELSRMVAGVRPLERRKVQYIVHAQKRSLREFGYINAVNVTAELAKIASYNVSDVFDYNSETGEISLKDLNEIDTSAIASIEPTLHGPKIKFHNKLTALEMLGKHLGLFRDRVEVTGKDGGAIEVADARASLESKLDLIMKRRSNEQFQSLMNGSLGEEQDIIDVEVEDEDKTGTEDN